MFSEYSAQAVDLYERKLERYNAGATRKIEDAFSEYPKIMASLRKWEDAEGMGVLERMRAIRSKFARSYEISQGYDCPDPPAIVDDGWLLDLKDSSNNDKSEFDWHICAEEINRHIQFCYQPSFNAFWYYNPVSGAWETDADDLVSNLLRKAFPRGIGRYHREEIMAWLKDYNIQGPDFFDSPDGDHINLKNGVFNVKSGKMEPHSPDFRFRYMIPVRFNRHKFPHLFWKTLQEITADDPKKAIKIMEAFAFPLMPGYYPQKAFILYGNGNNGKSTILTVLSAFLGRRNISSVQLQSLADNRFAAASLIGKLANISGDVSQREVMDSSLFKLLTGGDMVSVEIKGVQRRPEFVNSAKLIFSFNQLPYSYDRTEAYFRRFELVKLIQNFAGREDETLPKRLTSEDELSGILNLVLYIFLPAMLKKNKFHDSKTAAEVKLEYSLSADTALAYVQAKLEANPDSQMLADEIYNDYVEWCSSEGITSVSKESFGNTLLNRSGMIVQKRRRQEEGIQRYHYVGISWKTDSLDSESKNEQKPGKSLAQEMANYLETSHVEASCLGCLGCLGSVTLDMSGDNSSRHVKGREKLGNPSNPSNSPASTGSANTPEQKKAENTGSKEDKHLPYNKAAVVLMRFLEDISLAYYDVDKKFHAEDIAYVPPEWVDTLVRRGTASVIHVPEEKIQSRGDVK